jgi:hypothetical protein
MKNENSGSQRKSEPILPGQKIKETEMRNSLIGYVVEIVLIKTDKNGKPHPKGAWGPEGKSSYITFNRRNGCPLLCKTKKAAEVFASREAAACVSDYFWSQYWDKEEYRNRKVTPVMKRGV